LKFDVFLNMLEIVEWRKFLANRIVCMMLDAPKEPILSAEAKEYIEAGFGGFGDTVIIENSHNILRQIITNSSHDSSSPSYRQYKLIVGQILQGRGLQVVEPTERALPIDAAPFWETPAKQLDESWSGILSNQRDWLSITPESSVASMAAWRWLRHAYLLEQVKEIVSLGILSSLAKVGSLLLDNDNPQWYLSLGNATYACFLWPMLVFSNEPLVLYVDVNKKTRLEFLFDMERWRAARWKLLPPTELRGPFPRIMWEVTEEPRVVWQVALDEKADMSMAVMQ
jgi:hypothetical protein